MLDIKMKYEYLVCKQDVWLKYIPVLPFAFITLHFGFGLGLITSWLQRLNAKGNGNVTIML